MLQLTIFVLVGLAVPAYANKPLPPSPPDYIYNENVVTPDAERAISGALRSFEASTGHQFVLALFQSLEGESLEEYSNRLFKNWAVGSRKQNDGLLVCVFKQEHRWRIEVGYGLEPILTDLEAADIFQKAAVPYFKEGNYDEGVAAAVQLYIAKLSAPAGENQSEPLSRDEQIRLLRLAQFVQIAKIIFWLIAGFYFVFWYTFEHGVSWGFSASGARYPIRFFVIGGLYCLLLVKMIMELLRLLMVSAYYGGGSRGGGWGGGGGDWGGGGFSGGGGSSGGGGASGSW